MRIRNLGDVVARDQRDDAIWLIEVGPDGRDRYISYRDFHRDADAVARGLLKRGLKLGERVGLLAGNSAAFLIAYVGLMRAGLVPVPISFKLQPEVLAHIFADSQIKLMLVDEDRTDLAGGLPAVRIDDPQEWGQLLDPGPFAAVEMQDGDFATILYTSGSTGTPKGVPLTHGGYLWVTDVLSRSGQPLQGKRVLVAAPLFHMNGLMQSVVSAANGATVVLLQRFTGVAYLAAAARYRCQVVTSVPTMLALAARDAAQAAERLDLSHVETVVTGSAPSTEALFDRIAALFPNAIISNLWGTTESSPVAFGPHPRGLPRPKLSLGYPSPEVELKLVGGADKNEGVLWVRNKAVTPGYLNLPKETAKRIKDGWYETGDVMRRDAGGFYYFVGRADDMFVCGGENIYPGELERLLEKHAAVHQAVVVPVPDEIKGHVPGAFIVARPGYAVTADELKAYALGAGPAYMHPRFVEFMSELPLAGTNKIDRSALVRLAIQRFKR